MLIVHKVTKLEEAYLAIQSVVRILNRIFKSIKLKLPTVHSSKKGATYC